MISIARSIAQSPFLRQNAIFFIGSTVVSFLNYLYYPVLGRLLSPADFGEVQAIISFFLQTGVLLSVLSLVTINVVKRYPQPTDQAPLLAEIERIALWIGLIFCVAMAIASTWLQGLLNFTSPWPFLLLAFSVLLGVPGAFAGAYIQAHQRFTQLSTANILGAGSKLMFSAAFVLVGLRAVGAVMGVVASQILSLIYSTVVARRLGRQNSFRQYLVLRRPDVSLIRPELRYAGLVLLTSLAVNTILSLDILFAKHYFEPVEAGLYAGIATVARIIFFLTGPLTGVLVASVIPLGPAAANRDLLKRSVFLLMLLGGGALGLFVLWPGWVTSLLVGPRYIEVAHLLPTLSLAIFILSLANLLLLYQVALRRIWAAPAAVVGLVVIMGWLLRHHQSISDIVNGLLAGSIVLLISTLITGWWGKRVL